jgi:hypothetical protein
MGMRRSERYMFSPGSQGAHNSGQFRWGRTLTSYRPRSQPTSSSAESLLLEMVCNQVDIVSSVPRFKLSNIATALISTIGTRSDQDHHRVLSPSSCHAMHLRSKKRLLLSARWTRMLLALYDWTTCRKRYYSRLQSTSFTPLTIHPFDIRNLSRKRAPSTIPPF